MEANDPNIPFVEEIDFTEVELLEVVGKGSFGVVNKGKWRGKFVAVKMIEGESEKKAFIVERQQLSRVNHPNIVKLYGSCTKSPVCLVMEYAEGGSLYNILHVTPRANYTASHAMSWALQCARGVAYLHDMKPKALIHRDLKPPNLLLIMGGTVLKICDFGTACNLQTHMTNNKGSAAWMAPEVFEGSIYSEKCDVFSWGIILWEVLTRQQPFCELGGTAFCIMWAVHNGTRPPLIRGCPTILEKLMIRCWDKSPQRRPSMGEVVEIMTELYKYFKGADEPIMFTVSDEESSSTAYPLDDLSIVSEEVELQSSQVPSPEDDSKSSEDQLPAFKDIPVNNPPQLPAGWSGKPTVLLPISVVVDDKFPPSPAELGISGATPSQRLMSQTSAPPSLASSCENLSSLPSSSSISSNVNDKNQKRLSADLTNFSELKIDKQSAGNRMTGSYGSLVTNAVESKSPLHGDESPRRNMKPERPPPPFSQQQQQSPFPRLSSPWNASHFGGSQQMPGFLSPPLPQTPPNGSPRLSEYATNLEFYQIMLEPQLQPLPPFPKSAESMQVFEEHKKAAEEFIRIQAEFRLLMKRKEELTEELSKDVETVNSGYSDADKYINEALELQAERDSLRSLHEYLTTQLDQLKNQRKRNFADDWVMLP